MVSIEERGEGRDARHHPPTLNRDGKECTPLVGPAFKERQGGGAV